MTKMAAARRTRGPDRGKSNVGAVKVEDAVGIVQMPPLFTADSKFLCLVSGQIIRVYSVASCDKVFTLKLHNTDIIGISMKNENILVACDNMGRVMEWDVRTGKKLPNQKQVVIGPGIDKFYFFLSPGSDKYLVTTNLHTKIGDDHAATPTHVDLWVVEPDLQAKKIFGYVKNSPTAVAFSRPGNNSLIVAGIKDNNVVVKDLVSGMRRMHMTDERTFTCVALHPNEFIMATGDISGRILIWHDFMRLTKPPKTVYHWHTLPVNSISFSHEGNYFYSGGSEKTLVKWRMGSKDKQFLPRMGSVIKFVTNAPDNMCIATSHTDNAIRFVNGVNKITCAILGLMKHDPIRGLEGKESLMPVGLIWDPRSRGIFFNGQAGHLQLFDLEHSSVVFNLDIANRNILTDERHQVIGNTEVMRAALSSDGAWMATLEIWSNNVVGYKDMQLKMWQFNATLSNYELNTSVAMPHHAEVLALAFQPGAAAQQWPCLVSIGLDAKFKIWRLVDDTDIYRKKEAWTCDVSGDFRQQTPTAVSFSEDGSLLAISFDDTVTLWDPTSSNLKATLAHSLVDQHIQFMEFGRDQCFRYLVCATEDSIFTWDVITHGLVWKVGQLRAPIVSLAADSKSVHMAVVLQNCDVFVVAPSSSKPVYQQEKVLGGEPLAAVFIPRPNPLAKGPEWLINSSLVLADANQELYCLDDQSGVGVNKKVTSGVSYIDSLPWTPFAAMKAQQQITAAKKLTPTIHDTKGILGYESIQTLMETPSSTLPPMSRICSSFLYSFLKPQHEKVATHSAEVHDGRSTDADADAEVSESLHERSNGPNVALQRLNHKNIVDDDFVWLFRNVEQ